MQKEFSALKINFYSNKYTDTHYTHTHAQAHTNTRKKQKENYFKVLNQYYHVQMDFKYILGKK